MGWGEAGLEESAFWWQDYERHSVSGGKIVNVCQNILPDSGHFKPAGPLVAIYLGKMAI